LDAATGIDASVHPVVTFSEAMAAATVTTNTSGTTCSGSVQLSSTSFASCVQMSSGSLAGAQYTLVPAADLTSLTTYRLRVTTAVEDLAGNPMAAPADTSNGFRVQYFHTISIADSGTNDFVAADERFDTSTTPGEIYLAHDNVNLYLGMEHPAILSGGTGSGNKWVYFLISEDSTLQTGNTLSSDGKAQFGAAGTQRMHYHWKERVDGALESEYRVGDGTNWNDWGSSGKSSYRTTGYVEASIPISQIDSSCPCVISVTAYLVDYDGDSGNGWLLNMFQGATDGSGATPRPLVGYVELPVPTAVAPNDATLLKTF
ncbi:MAG: Ig-like domain-containing protein, partial [Deltaproteobacteria bacterium]|nr:Ig-like domain-containing protein [Deltaproteobacteria bacterium]MBW2534592.1 Ig-like domain-containing protein [Deltaproteobacteria bacterium]